MTVYSIRGGGFGNQMFQLAAAMTVDADGDGRLVGWSDNTQMSIEEIAPTLLTPVSFLQHLRLGRLWKDPSGWQVHVDRLVAWRRRRLHDCTYYPTQTLEGCLEHRLPYPANPKVLVGNFQHPDWYRASLPRLVDGLLQNAPSDLRSRMGGRAVVSVRGGDYNDFNWLLSDQYYRDAFTRRPFAEADIVSEDAGRASELVALLDELGCAATHLPGAPVDDFWKLAAASHLVMSNSTFCWWAAQVGDELCRRERIERVVLAPAGWLAGGLGAHLLEGHWEAL